MLSKTYKYIHNLYRVGVKPHSADLYDVWHRPTKWRRQLNRVCRFSFQSVDGLRNLTSAKLSFFFEFVYFVVYRHYNSVITAGEEVT